MIRISNSASRKNHGDSSLVIRHSSFESPSAPGGSKTSWTRYYVSSSRISSLRPKEDLKLQRELAKIEGMEIPRKFCRGTRLSGSE